ncbi:MAG: hypothetical protein ACR2NW_03605 [Thermodesulfobacteriota bacterium]
MKSLIVIFFLSSLIFGCGNPKIVSVLQEDSVGQIPCPAEKIEIIEHQKKENGDMMWTALCLGDTYQCDKKGGVVSCSEMASQFPN